MVLASLFMDPFFSSHNFSHFSESVLSVYHQRLVRPSTSPFLTLSLFCSVSHKTGFWSLAHMARTWWQTQFAILQMRKLKCKERVYDMVLEQWFSTLCLKIQEILPARDIWQCLEILWLSQQCERKRCREWHSMGQKLIVLLNILQFTRQFNKAHPT